MFMGLALGFRLGFALAFGIKDLNPCRLRVCSRNLPPGDRHLHGTIPIGATLSAWQKPVEVRCSPFHLERSDALLFILSTLDAYSVSDTRLGKFSEAEESGTGTKITSPQMWCEGASSGGGGIFDRCLATSTTITLVSSPAAHLAAMLSKVSFVFRTWGCTRNDIVSSPGHASSPSPPSDIPDSSIA